MSNSLRFFSLIALLSLLANCALVVEPTYRRAAPEVPVIERDSGVDQDVLPLSDQPSVMDDDVAMDDVMADVMDDATDGTTLIDGGAFVDADVVSDQPTPPSFPSRCDPNTREICNGIDDNCNGSVDELPADPTVRCVTDDGRLGTRGNQCVCVPTLTPSEICYNGLDDDGNAMTPDNCSCDAVVSGSPMVSITTDDSLQAAIARLMLRPANQRVICLVTPLPPMPNAFGCTQNWQYDPAITLPADVQLVGSFYPFAPGSIRRDPVNCRPTLRGAVVFAPTATRMTSLTGVFVNPVNVNAEFAVDMQGNGNLDDVIVLREAAAASESIGIGSNSLADNVRMMRNVQVSVLRSTQHSTGIIFIGGRLFTSSVGVQVGTTSNAHEARGIHLHRLNAAGLYNTSILAIRGGTLAMGVHVSEPQGITAIQGMNSSVPAIANAPRDAKVVGMLLECAGAPASVSAVNYVWTGGTTNTDGGVSVGIESNNCNLVLTGTPGMVPRSSVIGAAQQSPVVFGGQSANNASAILCRGGSCQLSYAALRAVSSSVGASGVVNATGVRVDDGAQFTLSDVNVEASVIPSTLLTASIEQLAIGIDVVNGGFFGERVKVSPSISRGGGAQQKGVVWRRGSRFVLRESVVIIQDGVGLQIDVGQLSPTVSAVVASNTFYRVLANTSLSTLIQLDVQGNPRAGASFRVVNNIFSPLTNVMMINGGVSAMAIRSETRSVFSLFTHNLIADSPVLAQVNGVAFNDPMTTATALSVVGGTLRTPMSVGFVSPGNFHIVAAPLSSEARGNGYLPAVDGRLDFDREARPRPMLAADIGADEVD